MPTKSPLSDGGSAFPRMPAIQRRGEYIAPDEGMSLRDYFAGQALCGIIAGAVPLGDLFEPGKEVTDAQAQALYMIADAMIAWRQRREDNHATD